ncbi:MAG: hypothetical protein E6767_20695 [Dysgonomonas sp.]|nr:hypothetical protein [Dysgonomonas sp.]
MTIAEIKDIITSNFISIDIVKRLYGLDENKSFEDQFSTVSLENIIFSVIATAIGILSQLFDLHKQEVTEIIADQKPHSLRWYAWLARQFQYGFNLLPDSDQFDNTGKTDEQIEASKIVTYAACTKGAEGKLLLKVATDNGDDLAPLDETEKEAFTEYINRVQDAGDDLEIISTEADTLKLIYDIYYNPLVINAKGERVAGESLTPVPDAIRQYLKNLPFNGELVTAYLTDALQRVDGVVIPHLKAAEWTYGDVTQGIEVKALPYSGYFRVTDDNLEINYIAQSEILK